MVVRYQTVSFFLFVYTFFALVTHLEYVPHFGFTTTSVTLRPPVTPLGPLMCDMWWDNDYEWLMCDIMTITFSLVPPSSSSVRAWNCCDQFCRSFARGNTWRTCLAHCSPSVCRLVAKYMGLVAQNISLSTPHPCVHMKCNKCICVCKINWFYLI